MAAFKDKKAAVVAAYADLAQSLTKASLAIQEFGTVLNATTDKEELAHTLEFAHTSLPLFTAALGPPLKVKGKRATKEKKEKDPNAPKKPPSAYLDFQNAVRDDFRQREPDLPYSELLRKVSLAWTEMPAEEKKVWQDKTADKTATWEVARKEYAATGAPAAAPADAATGEKESKKKGKKADKEAADPGFLQAVAAQTVAAGKEKKEKKKAEATAPVSASKAKTTKAAPVKEPTPESESDDESDDSDDESDDDSESSDDAEAVAAAVAPKPVASTSKAANGKSATKRAADAQPEKSKKKTKSA